jgi:hypothetical protein
MARRIRKRLSLFLLECYQDEKSAAAFLSFLLVSTLISSPVLAYETQRPSESVDYGATREDSAYSDGVGAVGLGVYVKRYRENDQTT